jgi:hypothetical protein
MLNAFNSDLDIGVDIERAVLEQIHRKFPCAVQINGKFKGYDIWIPEIHKSVEVKSDQKSQYTGNFLIECEMYGKASALLSTTADYWVIYDGKEYSWYRPTKIIECVIRTQLKPARFTSRGDTEQKLAYLVPVESLKGFREEGIK